MNFTNNDEDFVHKIIKSKEGIDLEFKQKITSETKIAKTISALANAKGGLIIVGISDQKRIVGIDPDEEIFMIEKANSIYCSPPANLSFEIIKWNDPEPSPYEQAEKYILKVEVFRNLAKPIAFLTPDGQSKIYRRSGDQSKLVP
ncbi:AlbA family DNA-binding domain-containing protein [Algoriphagus hitonicola]|uniref:Putative DNA-binding domain-containing protein n=1 Tax=Algoriphagus hitonicola TaxID=435880 RepID=A0A1I2RAH1_9BACT|nr:ATP-binding protein [Algoriphagus hitonicola]SFG34796.1 Putative DNA-binding domain-containing protein [Algoriphagus hitonicola]